MGFGQDMSWCRFIYIRKGNNRKEIWIRAYNPLEICVHVGFGTESSLRKVWRYQGGIISKKNRQRNGQKKKYRRTNNDLQNIHIKLKIE
jgi:hypothetical protein